MNTVEIRDNLIEVFNSIEHIKQLQNPYPESVFKEPDWTKVTSVLQAAGINESGVAGSLSRTCWNNIKSDFDVISIKDIEAVIKKLDRLAELEECLWDIAETDKILDAQKAKAVLEGLE